MVQHVERPRSPGRNDPCPCGSGKKYKRCCLAHEAPHLPDRTFEDVIAEIAAADEAGDPEAALHLLEEERLSLRDPDLDGMLVERYLELPANEAEDRLHRWWDQEHDRFSGAGLARVLIDGERRNEALAVLIESQGADAWPEYWRLLGILRDEQGDIEAAVAAMELYTRLAPEQADAWIALADMQQRAGHNDRALLSLRRAGDALPESILPRTQRLRILADEGRWREARDLAEALLEGEYDDATPEILYEVRDALARAYFVLGEFDEARHLWDTLLEERPDDRDVRHRLAGLELTARRHRRAMLVLEPYPEPEPRVLDIRLHCLLALREYDQAALVARQIEQLDPLVHALPLVQAAEAIVSREYGWALEQLDVEPPDRFRDLWNNLRLDCLAHLGRWQEIPATLKSISQPDDAILARAALGCLAAGKLDLTERLLEEIEDQQSTEARSLSGLLGPLRQSRRAAEVRRQQQVDQTEKQRRAAESRELRRRLRELERHNAALADALAGSEAALERLLELVGVSGDGGVPVDWEIQLQRIADRAHKDALAHELQQAERRLLSMLGSRCWNRLSESARASLREGEWLFAAVEGEDRDYGAALLEYARGLERAFKDAIFVPLRTRWERQQLESSEPPEPETSPISHLQDEGHDPSLSPLVRYLLQGSHLTLGSMAAALIRMADVRRQGVAISLLRSQLGIDPQDQRTLEDWRRTAERLALAADARNRPAHAGSVSREEVRQFRELVLGTDGLLRALDSYS